MYYANKTNNDYIDMITLIWFQLCYVNIYVCNTHTQTQITQSDNNSRYTCMHTQLLYRYIVQYCQVFAFYPNLFIYIISFVQTTQFMTHVKL